MCNYIVNRWMLHTILMLTANGFAQKANLTTDQGIDSNAKIAKKSKLKS